VYFGQGSEHLGFRIQKERDLFVIIKLCLLRAPDWYSYEDPVTTLNATLAQNFVSENVTQTEILRMWLDDVNEVSLALLDALDNKRIGVPANLGALSFLSLLHTLLKRNVNYV